MSIKNFFNRLKFWKRTHTEHLVNPEDRLANKLKQYESYVFKTQSILMWENPAVSILCVISVNILFWIIVNLQWRFYGIVCSALLVMSLHEAWVQQIWPEIRVPPKKEPEEMPARPTHPSVIAVSRFVTNACTVSKDYLNWLKTFRTQQPGVFCCGICLLFAGLILVGNAFSGMLLAYLILMAVLIGPGIVLHVVPPQMKQTAVQYWTCFHSMFAANAAGGEMSEDEYIPETSTEDMALLSQVSDLHQEMRRSSDSITAKGSSSDPVSGLSLMPSHEEVDSLATLSDFEPSLDDNNVLPLDPALDDSSDSAADEAEQIQFQSGHFNGETSSSEDGDISTTDLEFGDPIIEQRSDDRGLLTAFISQAVATNVLGVIQKSIFSHSQQPSSSQSERQKLLKQDSNSSGSDVDDDFEMIDKEELNKHDLS